jgi:hypothetical protein
VFLRGSLGATSAPPRRFETRRIEEHADASRSPRSLVGKN